MIRKLLVAGAIVTGTVAMMAGTAFAHVEIERVDDSSSDGIVEATLTVPSEEPDAGTVKIALIFPESPSIESAEPGSVDGWTAEVEKDADGAVTEVVWTGGPLTGEEEVELPISLGLADGPEKVDFKAVQTYDDGEEVRWIEPTPEGGEEPEHPAPVLLLSGEADGHDDTATTDTHSEDADHDDGLSTGAIVAIVAGVVIVLALLGWVLSRSRRSSGSRTD